MSGFGDHDEQLHASLLAGDPTAPSQVILAHLDPLTRRLRGRFPDIRDETLLLDAATDALLDYVQSPSKFDPSKSSLTTYLTLAARGDLLNALAKSQRRSSRQVSIEIVAEPEDIGNIPEEGDPAEQVADLTAARDLTDAMLKLITEQRDRQLLALMVDGERRTEPYARLLGISHLDEGEKRRTVKQHKDRIKKRLQRGIKRHD
jgi:RNA polymerase sigma-70 factor (ECF subfamily)